MKKITGKLYQKTINTNSSKQNGAAITEFVIMLVVMVPMFLMIPIMGKVGDLNSTTIQASRYAAWERTASDRSDKTDKRLELEMQNRFYTNMDIGIQTGRGQLKTKKDQNPLWRGYGKERVFNSPQKDAMGTLQAGKTPGKFAGQMAGAISKIGGAFSSFNDKADFDINMRALYQANVAVNVGSNRIGFDGSKNCDGKKDKKVFSCIKRHSVLLTDGWSAGSRRNAESRTAGMVMMGSLTKLEKAIKLVGKIPGFTELGGFKPGYVDSSVIAPDRLGVYKGK